MASPPVEPDATPILVADDDALVRDALVRLLRRNGYAVTTAATGVEALAILSAPGAPRAALVDWMMPELDGVELCKRVRALDHRAYPYLIVVTGKADTAAGVAALDAGADEVICKPWAPSEILARLRAGLRMIEGAAALGSSFQSELTDALASGGGGEVVVRSGDVVGRVFVHAGRIAWVDLPTEVDSFRSLLEAHVHISDDEWRALVEECRVERTNIFDALVRWELAPPAAVAECVRTVIARRLQALTDLPTSKAVFLPRSRAYATDILFTLDELPEVDRPSLRRPPLSSDPPASAAPPSVPPPGRDGRATDVVRGLLAIDGAVAAAVLDMSSSEILALSAMPGLRRDELEGRVRAQGRALRSLATDDGASEMISVADSLWHLMVRSEQTPGHCLYLALEMNRTPLAMARIRLHKVDATVIGTPGGTSIARA